MVRIKFKTSVMLPDGQELRFGSELSEEELGAKISSVITRMSWGRVEKRRGKSVVTLARNLDLLGNQVMRCDEGAVDLDRICQRVQNLFLDRGLIDVIRQDEPAGKKKLDAPPEDKAPKAAPEDKNAGG